jgi:hypothetical protein
MYQPEQTYGLSLTSPGHLCHLWCPPIPQCMNQDKAVTNEGLGSSRSSLVQKRETGSSNRAQFFYTPNYLLHLCMT